MTNTEINDRATTIANMAALASKLDHGAERLLIMEVAALIAGGLPAPRIMAATGDNVIPFTGGKA